MSQYFFFCVIADSETLFSITIDTSKTVDGLKKAIKKDNKNELRDYDTAKLMLYSIDVKLEDPRHIEEVRDITQNLSNHEPLKPWLKLSAVFQPTLSAAPPSEDSIHVLVMKPPTGESYSSRACTHTVDALSLTQPHSATAPKTPPNHPVSVSEDIPFTPEPDENIENAVRRFAIPL